MANEVGIFFSLILFLIGGSWLASTKEWLEFYRAVGGKSYSGILISLYTIPAGLVILSFHNNWELRFSLFVTLMGWGLVLKGIALLLFPYLPQKKMPAPKVLRLTLVTGGSFMMIFSALSGLSYFW